MIKRMLGILAIAAVGTALAAGPYNKGDNTITASVGYGMAGIAGDASIPPVSLSYDYGFNENISFGAIGAYSSSSQKIFGTFGYDYTYILVGARGAWHFNDLFKGKPIDPYIGALLGYNIVSATATGTTFPGAGGAAASYMAFGGYLGARYWFSSNLGAQLELGYGAGLAAIGLSYRM